MLESLLFSVADQRIDIVGIAEALLLDLPLTLEQPCVRVFDPDHELQKFSTDAGADVLDQALVVDRGLLIEGKLAADLIQLVQHALGVYVEEVEILIDRKA